MKFEIKKRPWDIILVVIISFIMLILNYFIHVDYVRIIIGLLFVLFIPGYVMVSALFPKNNEMSIMERIVLSFSVSVVIIPIIGLIVNFAMSNISFDYLFFPIFIFVIALSVVSYYRRIKTPMDSRFSITFSIALPAKKLTALNLVLVLLVCLLIIIASGMIYFFATTIKSGDDYTEFYVLDINGKAQNYPTNLTSGEVGSLQIGVVNHENALLTYRVEINLIADNNSNISEITQISDLNSTQELTNGSGVYTDISLHNEQTWEWNFKFSVSHPDFYKLQFVLYKMPDENNHYRQAYLWINVKV